MAAKKKLALTPLARSLRGRVRQSPLTLFEHAKAKWLKGERLEITQLASELGVARTTVFRWAGTREQLYGEVVSTLYARLRSQIIRATPGRGLTRFRQITHRTLDALSTAAPLRAFIAQDPEFAIRVLTSRSSPVQARSIQLEVELLREIVQEEGITPALDIDTLAFVIVRISEAFLYSDVISGRKPEVEKAVAAICILVGGQERDGRPDSVARGGKSRVKRT